MNRIYKPYTDWEEVDYGMYVTDVTNKDHHLKNAVNLLKSPSSLYHFMKRTIEEWENSTLHNMTNESLNRQAWLGQAACSIKDYVPAEYTKEAWSMISDNEREEANAVADKVIEEWEKSYAKDI